MYLTMFLSYKEILNCNPKSLLFYHFTGTRTKCNISATQHKLQYHTGVEMEDNVTQHWWYSTILTRNTISNTDKLAKMVYATFLVNNPHHSVSENIGFQPTAFDTYT